MGADPGSDPATQIEARRGLPPGQKVASEWRVQHYGRVPQVKDPAHWDLMVFGATASGHDYIIGLPTLASLPRVRVRADHHCVSGYSTLDLTWEGVQTRALFDIAPPHDDARYVLAWAQYGYSANLSRADFAADTSLIATHVQGEPLAPERGGPLRLVVPHLYAWKGPKWLRAIEYLTEDRRGFWEERGYHNDADPWSGQRYSYQEPGESAES